MSLERTARFGIKQFAIWD